LCFLQQFGVGLNDYCVDLLHIISLGLFFFTKGRSVIVYSLGGASHRNVYDFC
jgi:hypothetical protein